MKSIPQMGSHHYFLTLCTASRKQLFDQWPDLRRDLEHLWRKIWERELRLVEDSFSINGRCLHALLQLEGEPSRHEALIEEAMQSFSQQAHLAWRAHAGPPAGEEFWQLPWKVRRVLPGEELESLKEFMMQKMMGGELTDLGLDEEDE